MALICCPECNREISDRAVACPICGCPANDISVEYVAQVTSINVSTVTIAKKQVSYGQLEKQYGRLAFYEHVVVDSDSGLMWVRRGDLANSSVQYNEAVRHVSSLNYAGYNDWRLPTLEEMKKLTGAKTSALTGLMSAFSSNNEDFSKHMRSMGFTYIRKAGYWTSTSMKICQLDGGYFDSGSSTSYSNVLPVRTLN